MSKTKLSPTSSPPRHVRPLSVRLHRGKAEEPSLTGADTRRDGVWLSAGSTPLRYMVASFLPVTHPEYRSIAWDANWPPNSPHVEFVEVYDVRWWLPESFRKKRMKPKERFSFFWISECPSTCSKLAHCTICVCHAAKRNGSGKEAEERRICTESVQIIQCIHWSSKGETSKAQDR